nr:GPI-anchored adhesin-like protein precursor [Ipomoea batatas]
MHIIKGAWSMPTIALATCKDSGGKKTRIRRSKEERKSMVETFIKTYQKSNDGSFPSLRLTHKEVGGSFYTVREIVREIIQENRVLGPVKLNSEEQTDQISLEQHPLGSLCTESHISLSSTGEIHVITDAAPNRYQENDVLDSNSHFHGADNSLDNGKTVSSGRSKGNEGCEEPATADFVHDYNGNIQEQLLHSNQEFPVSYDQKFHNGCTNTFDKDESSSKSGTVNNSSLHQQDATENQVHYLGVNITEACNQSLDEQIIDGSSPRAEKDQACGESVYIESLITQIPDKKVDGIEKLEESKVGITQKTSDVVVEKFSPQAMSTTIDHRDGKLSETGDASHRTGREHDGGNFSENCSGLMSEQVDVAKRETLLESGESSLQISTSSNEMASDTEFKADDSSAIIKTSNGSSTNSSQTTLVPEESRAINNTPSVQRNSIHQKGPNPPVSRPNLETRKSATVTPNKSEPNPLLALFKAFVTAFVKFWTEE